MREMDNTCFSKGVNHVKYIVFFVLVGDIDDVIKGDGYIDVCMYCTPLFEI